MIEPASNCPSSDLVFQSSETLKAAGVPHWILYPVEREDYETVGRTYWCYQPNVDDERTDAYKHHLSMLCWAAFNEIVISTKRADGEQLNFEETLALLGSFAVQYNNYLRTLDVT